jgi:single-strand DNA-binding protein
MIHATVIGRLGADAEVRQAGNSQVLSLRAACSFKVKKDEENTTWVSISMFGERAAKLAEFDGCKKGKMIAARGTLYAREHNGKTYLELKAEEIEMLSPREGGASNGASYGKSGGGSAKHTANDDSFNYGANSADDVPY